MENVLQDICSIDGTPSPDFYDCLMTLLGIACLPTNRAMCDKLIWLTGSGRNGKSLVVDLLTAALGDYCANSNLSYLSSGGSNPHTPKSGLVKLIPKRVAIFNEADQGFFDAGNDAVFKQFTGDEHMSVREVHQTEKEAVVLATGIAVCNHLPSFPQGNAFEERFIGLAFTNKYTAESGEALTKMKEEEADPVAKKCLRVADSNIRNELKGYRQEMMCLLMEHLQGWCDSGCPSIKRLMNEQFPTIAKLSQEVFNQGNLLARYLSGKRSM